MSEQELRVQVFRECAECGRQFMPPNGRRSRQCRLCRAAKTQAYYNRNQEREITRARERRRTQAEKCKARTAVRLAIRRGIISKPDACSACGVTPERLDAHHFDYGQPLNVEWLCGVCHGLRHSRPKPSSTVPRTLKTHCPRGHEYTPENTMIQKRHGGSWTSRTCRECHKARLRELRRQKRLAL